MKAIDLTGQRFGNWTVLQRVPVEVVKAEYPRNKGEAMWYCKCKCGEVSLVTGGNLRFGRSHGCLSCSAYGRHNGGNPWSRERRERRERMDKAASER